MENKISSSKAGLLMMAFLVLGFISGHFAGKMRGSKEATKKVSEMYRTNYGRLLEQAYTCAPQCRPLTQEEECLQNDEIVDKSICNED